MRKVLISLVVVLMLGASVLMLALVPSNSTTAIAYAQSITPASSWVQWQQPVWIVESNNHGTVSTRLANGNNLGIHHRAGFNAFHSSGWDMLSPWTQSVYWRLALNYQIQIQSISFEASIHVSSNNHLPTTPVNITLNGQTQSYQPDSFGGRMVEFTFNFADWQTSIIDLNFAPIRAPITDDNWNGSTNTSIHLIRNLTITANVTAGHFSAYEFGRVEKYIELGNSTMIARDFELISDNNFITKRLLIGDHAIRLAFNSMDVRVYCYVSHPLGQRRINVQNTGVDFRGFWIRFENNVINVWDRFSIPATADTIIEMQTTFLSVQSVMTGHSGNPGIVRGWTGEEPVICRDFTIIIWNLQGAELGRWTQELDLSGLIFVTVNVITTRLPHLVVDGQTVFEYFFLVTSATGEIGTQGFHNFTFNLAHSNYRILAIDYVQITHTITFRTRHGSDFVTLGTTTLNWGDAIPDPATLHPNLPVTRGWQFHEWRHDPFTWDWSGDWGVIVCIIGSPIERNYTFTAEFRRLQLFTIRFQEPTEQSWGVWYRTIAQITIYENESINLDEVMVWHPEVPLSQHTPNILDAYTWNGGWISNSGFLVGHVLDDQPLTQPFGVHWTYIHFVPNTTPIEFFVSFMGWDGGYLARQIQTVGGYICPDTVPLLPNLYGLSFSHWFNSSDLELTSRITADTHFWAVYVPNTAPPIDDDENGNGNSEGVDTWLVVLGGFTAIIILLIVISVIKKLFRKRR